MEIKRSGFGQCRYCLLNTAAQRREKLNAVIQLDKNLEAPIAKGDVVGSIFYYIDEEKVGEAKLVSQESVEQGGIFKRLMDWFKLLFSGWF